MTLVHPIANLSDHTRRAYARSMDYTTIEAEIDHGQITVKEPGRLPERGRGLLILLPPGQSSPLTEQPRTRVRLPLIQGTGKRVINPTPEELDGSLWD
jgi:hypothetical protein